MSSTLADILAGSYNKFKNYIRASFSSLNEYDAEDIVQQTALNLLGQGETDTIASATSYIYTALRNGALNMLKKRHREQLGETVEAAEREGSAEDEALCKELKRHMAAAVNMLDEKSRFVFVETEINGKSYNELSEQTGEPIGTLLSRKSRAIKKLNIILDEYDQGGNYERRKEQ